jgi:hypothetical protein
MQIFGRLDKVAKAVKGWNSGVMPDDSSATLQQVKFILTYQLPTSGLMYCCFLRSGVALYPCQKFDDVFNTFLISSHGCCCRVEFMFLMVPGCYMPEKMNPQATTLRLMTSYKAAALPWQLELVIFAMYLHVTL